MTSRRQVVGGKRVAVLGVRSVLPRWDADGGSYVIRQRHNRNGLQPQNIQNHASDSFAVEYSGDLAPVDY
jgi:hypothetical protein